MSDDPLVGTVLEGKYELVKRLGVGGMGSVYLGQHVILGKRVAVKFLHADYARNASIVQRFFREAQAATAIGHKNIIDVLDVAVSAEGTPYLVMEYLEGESLAAMLTRRERLDFAAACGVMEPVLLALQAAHDKGIVHRDLKPDNVFLANTGDESPVVKLIDFGISKQTRGSGDTNLTQAGAVLGTPCYMSPEQAAGLSDLDARSDLWSAGCILHELLAGVPPFDGANVNMILAAVLTQEVVRPTTRFAGFPAEAEPVIMQALSRDRQGRFASAAEMLHALQCTRDFKRRHESLTLAAVGMYTDVASGDLGKAPALSHENTASEVLHKMAVRGTLKSGDHAYVEGSGSLGTQQAWSESSTAEAVVPTRRRWTWFAGLGAASLVLLAVGLKFALSSEPEPTPMGLVNQANPTPAYSAAPTAPEGSTARIVLRGVPEGATVMLGNTLQTSNTFSVARGDDPVQVSVEQEGYATFRTEITPSGDLTLDVTLKPEPATARANDNTGSKNAAAPSATATSKKTKVGATKTEPPTQPAHSPPPPPPPTQPTQPTHSPPPPTEPDEGRIKRGRRDTKYMEDFD